MILAGGRGTRLHDLTTKVAKPAVSYGGKYRIIDFPLSNCANSGIDNVGVLTQYESILLNSYVADAAGVWMRRTVVYMYFRLVKKRMLTWTYTAGLLMPSRRILTSSILFLRNISLFSPETIFTK